MQRSLFSCLTGKADCAGLPGRVGCANFHGRVGCASFQGRMGCANRMPKAIQRLFQSIEPIQDQSAKRFQGIRSIPAGSDTFVRRTGTSRPQQTIA